MFTDADTLSRVPYMACILICLAVGAFAPNRSLAPLYALLVSAIASLIFIVPSVGADRYLTFPEAADTLTGDFIRANATSFGALVVARIWRMVLIRAERPNGRCLVIDRSHLLRSVSRRRVDIRA